MVLVAGVLFGAAVLISLNEALEEHDWPRDTFKFVILSGIVLAFSLSL